MIFRLASSVLFTSAVFVAGYWFGSGSTPVQAQTQNRVFELRTYHTPEGKLDALLTRFRDHTVELFKKHGMTNIGYWVPTDEPLKGKTLIYVLAHPNREAAKASWAAFRSDPEWKKVAAASEANGKIVEKVDSVFMEPTDFSMMK
ncbi:MAG: NIPSNAP family protein [Bryobacteraceae bacterium]